MADKVQPDKIQYVVIVGRDTSGDYVEPSPGGGGIPVGSVISRENSFDAEVEFGVTELTGDLSQAVKTISLPSNEVLIENVMIVKKGGSSTHFDVELSKSDFTLDEDIFYVVRDISVDFSDQRELTYKSRDGSARLWVRVKSYCGDLSVKVQVSGRVRMEV